MLLVFSSMFLITETGLCWLPNTICSAVGGNWRMGCEGMDLSESSGYHPCIFECRLWCRSSWIAPTFNFAFQISIHSWRTATTQSVLHWLTLLFHSVWMEFDWSVAFTLSPTSSSSLSLSLSLSLSGFHILMPYYFWIVSFIMGTQRSIFEGCWTWNWIRFAGHCDEMTVVSESGTFDLILMNLVFRELNSGFWMLYRSKYPHNRNQNHNHNHYYHHQIHHQIHHNHNHNHNHSHNRSYHHNHLNNFILQWVSKLTKYLNQASCLAVKAYHITIISSIMINCIKKKKTNFALRDSLGISSGRIGWNSHVCCFDCWPLFCRSLDIWSISIESTFTQSTCFSEFSSADCQTTHSQSSASWSCTIGVAEIMWIWRITNKDYYAEKDYCWLKGWRIFI